MRQSDFPPPPLQQQPVKAPSLVQRLQQSGRLVKVWMIKWRLPLLILLNVAITLGVVMGYDSFKPSPQKVPQRDIDAAVSRSIASATPAPSQAALVFEIIHPSLVIVEAEVEGEKEGAIGSGVVFDDFGNILSALHVVDNAQKITVIFADGTKSSATILAKSIPDDIVVLSPALLPDDLVPAVLAGPPGIGDNIFTVGNPFGIVHSLTAGVVSGLGRNFTSRETGTSHKDLIQFDAAVNPGNSGGPLLNKYGEVVGIVTALLNPTEQEVFIGIGFAVPIATAASAAGEVPY
jgi:S1-C subfamily serine protease